jgi:hypothetical protein
MTTSPDEIARRTAELVQQGLDRGLQRQVAQLFDVLVSTSDAKAEERFLRGLDMAIATYTAVCTALVKKRLG